MKDGVAELRVVELPAEPGHDTPTGTRKVVVNVPSGSSAKDDSVADLVVVKSLSIRGAQTIVGPNTVPVKGGNRSKIVVQEGLWEDRRGHKVDGGERRWAESQAKRRAEERKNAS